MDLSQEAPLSHSSLTASLKQGRSPSKVPPNVARSQEDLPAGFQKNSAKFKKILHFLKLVFFGIQ
jgi:hypothetical protein